LLCEPVTLVLHYLPLEEA